MVSSWVVLCISPAVRWTWWISNDNCNVGHATVAKLGVRRNETGTRENDTLCEIYKLFSPLMKFGVHVHLICIFIYGWMLFLPSSFPRKLIT